MNNLPESFNEGVHQMTQFPASWSPLRPQADHDSLFESEADVMQCFRDCDYRAKLWIGEALQFADVIETALTKTDRFRLMTRGRRAIEAARKFRP